MRWSIIRLIWFRELRDQLRDRRTLFMVAVLPLVLYPILGVVVLQFALGFVERPSLVGIRGGEHLPTWTPRSAGLSPVPPASLFLLAPANPYGTGLDRVLGVAALFRAARRQQDYPPLLVNDRFVGTYFDHASDRSLLLPRTLEGDERQALEDKEVDLVLAVSPGFAARLEHGGRPEVQVLYREGDERSRVAAKRLYGVLARWKVRLREVRIARSGLPYNYEDPFEIRDAERGRPTEELAAEGLLDLLVRIFPFLLVMWSLAGALYPAVDLCAGEKERGTMETLLISPASRVEIVWGKFLTIWVFSAATALLNLASMGLTTWQFSGQMTQDILPATAVLWCILLALPLSAFFSALCLAMGAYARSSKEGQYYLMPLFLVTMPLIFLTLAPGVELNPFYSLVPVTGVALLMQRLMTSPLDQVPWLYFVPVLVPIMLYSWLALRWAIEQFNREEVLFREAERLDLGLWLRRLLREKEAVPTTSQAIFCFALIMALRWLFFASDGTLLVRTGTAYLAYVASPPLFMALLLTTRPLQSLTLRWPGLPAIASAGVLAALLLPPLAELTHFILQQFPVLKDLLQERQPLVEELQGAAAQRGATWWHYLLVLAVLPALCEELAFRGFILTGLRRRFPPWTAILLSSLLFAFYHMNVFQLLPAFVLGAVLALLTLHSGSLVPAVVFHLLHNSLILGLALLPEFGYTHVEIPGEKFLRPAITLACLLLGAPLLWWLGHGLTAAGPQPALNNQQPEKELAENLSGR
jgi:sodium transport system permease protein